MVGHLPWAPSLYLKESEGRGEKRGRVYASLTKRQKLIQRRMWLVLFQTYFLVAELFSFYKLGIYIVHSLQGMYEIQVWEGVTLPHSHLVCCDQPRVIYHGLC